MDSHVPRLPVGLVVVLALVGALVLGPSARATQPECQVVNLPPKKTTYTSNEYGYPLGIAITEAAPGDTLEVVGTCHGSFYIYMDLTLQGRPSANHADTIDGEGSTAVLTVDSTAAVTVTNLTITGGESGPGIYNYGTVTLIDSTVSGNTAASNHSGGGIFNDHGTLTLTDATVSGNSAASGGGISNFGGVVSLTNSTVSGNTASMVGGGIENGFGGTLTLIDSAVSGNDAVSAGGIYNHSATVTLTNSTFSDNTGPGGGGGISNWYGAVTLTGSTVSGNRANRGGGILSYLGSLTLIDSTVSGNTAFTYGGGGIYYYGYPDSLKLTNSTVSGNTPDQILTVPPP